MEQEEIIEQEEKNDSSPTNLSQKELKKEKKNLKKRNKFMVTGEAGLALKPDIKYRGPLSYRVMRIIGWLCFELSVLGLIMGIIVGISGDPNAEKLQPLIRVLKALRSYMMPFFLIANYSIILKERYSYKNLFRLYGSLTLLIIISFYLFSERYLDGALHIFFDTAEQRLNMKNAIFKQFASGGINVFLDLLLCTLFTYFVNYKPKKYFQGKKIYIFRSFAFLVVIYEIASFVLKILMAQQKINISTYLTPWVATKPPILFVAFVFITFFIKNREKLFIKHGGSKELYESFLQTNRNSLHVSVFMTIIFSIASIIDFLILVILIGVLSLKYGDMAMIIVDSYTTAGIGGGVGLIFISPILLLFSYTRRHKNKYIDRYIPIGGIIIAIFLVIEGIYFVLTHL